MEHLKANSVKLKDRTLWFDGDSSVSEDEIVHLLSAGLPIGGLFVENITDTIKQYNQLVPSEDRIEVKTKSKELSLEWNLPEKYKTLNVRDYVDMCLYRELEQKMPGQLTIPYDMRMRVSEEMELYYKLNLFDVLRTLIYIINTLCANNIIWSVGRGSSVSSYVLYLIGVHDVDSLKYGLDIEDFLRANS